MSLLLVFPCGSIALTPRELAERTGMSLPTIYRLAQALCEHGMLMREGPRFRLGMTLLRLGMLVAAAIDVRKQALPHLRWLNAQTGENAELHMRQGEARIVLEMVSSPHNLRPFADIGAPIPLHRGAAGKVLLAWLPQEAREPLIAASAARFDAVEPGAPGPLPAQLAAPPARGGATSPAETAPAVRAVVAS